MTCSMWKLENCYAGWSVTIPVAATWKTPPSVLSLNPNSHPPTAPVLISGWSSRLQICLTLPDFASSSHEICSSLYTDESSLFHMQRVFRDSAPSSLRMLYVTNWNHHVSGVESPCSLCLHKCLPYPAELPTYVLPSPCRLCFLKMLNGFLI